jgi:hypothetical protein
MEILVGCSMCGWMVGSVDEWWDGWTGGHRQAVTSVIILKLFKNPLLTAEVMHHRMA